MDLGNESHSPVVTSGRALMCLFCCEGVHAGLTTALSFEGARVRETTLKTVVDSLIFDVEAMEDAIDDDLADVVGEGQRVGC